MKNKHIFIPVLDAGEMLPFAGKREKGKKFDDFIMSLQKNFKEKMYNISSDIIKEVGYERFIFKKSGFFEIINKNPVGIIAHFNSKIRAEKFRKALIKTLRKTIGASKAAEMFIDSIYIQDEKNQPFNYHKWENIKKIRESVYTSS